MASGDSASGDLSSSTSFTACTKYDNTATASADNAPDAQDSASIQCNKPSLSVTKTADNTSVDAGDPIWFTIEVANGGPGTAKNVTLADPLPAGTAADWGVDPAYPGPGTLSITRPPRRPEPHCSFRGMADRGNAPGDRSSST